MALIRGFQRLCPCPVCLVPNNEQCNITGNYKLQTSVETQQLVERAKACRTEVQREEILKAEGLHPIEVRASVYCCSDEILINVFDLVECILGYSKLRPIQGNILGWYAFIFPWSRWEAHLVCTSRICCRSETASNERS